MPAHYFFIVNPHAGGDSVAATWPKIKTILNKKHVAYVPYFTHYVGHAVAITQFLLTYIMNNSLDNPVIIAVGGDGTLHEIINGCMNYFKDHPGEPEVPVAFLPVGSGNDFARAANISLKWETALKDILTNYSCNRVTIGHYIDIHNHKEGYCTNVFGIGFDAKIVYTANHSLAKKNNFFGKFSYLLALLRVLFKFKQFPVRYQVKAKQGLIKNIFLLTTTNIPYFGGGVRIAPQASIFKNNLDLVLIEKPNLGQILHIIALLLLGQHYRLSYVHHYSVDKFTVFSKTKNFCQIDGETGLHSGYEVEYDTRSYLFWLGD